jgi:hypothetical protein
VVTVDARLAWNVDDVTPMAAWPIAYSRHPDRSAQ